MDMKEIALLVENATKGKILNVSLYLTGTKTITLKSYTDNITEDLKDHNTALIFMEVLLRRGNIMVIIDKFSDDLLNFIIDVVVSEKIKYIEIQRWSKQHKMFGEFYTQRVDMKNLKTYEKFNTKTLAEELFHDFKYIIEEGNTSDILSAASRLKYFKTKLVEMDLKGLLDE